MGTMFWIRRFLLVFTGAAVVIAAVQLLKGHGVAYALSQGLAWAAISSTVFTSARLFQARRGRHCALCRDTPEMREGRAP